MDAVQSQKAAYAYFTSKQMLPFGFADTVDATVNSRHVNASNKGSLDLRWFNHGSASLTPAHHWADA